MVSLRITKFNLDQEPTLREKAFFVIALLGLFVLFYNFFWDSQSRGIKALRIEQKSSRMQIEALQKLVEATNAQLTKWQDRRQLPSPGEGGIQWMARRAGLDPEEEINSTVNFLSGRKIKKRLKVSKVDVGNRIEKEAYVVVPVTVEIQGRYAPVVGYFEMLERAERPIVVESFSLGSGEADTGLLTARLNTELLLAKQKGK